MKIKLFFVVFWFLLCAVVFYYVYINIPTNGGYGYEFTNNHTHFMLNGYLLDIREKDNINTSVILLENASYKNNFSGFNYTYTVIMSVLERNDLGKHIGHNVTLLIKGDFYCLPMELDLLAFRCENEEVIGYERKL